jgi:hypothetical protein
MTSTGSSSRPTARPGIEDCRWTDRRDEADLPDVSTWSPEQVRWIQRNEVGGAGSPWYFR